MVTGKGFEIIVASLPDYQRLVAEIYYDGKFVLLISNEKSIENFDVETPGSEMKEGALTHKVDLDGLKIAMDIACQKLKGEIS